MAPYRGQAKKIAWGYLKRYSRPLNPKVSEVELSVLLANEAEIRLFGADNPDALRGGYLDGVVLDEYADMRPSVWGEIVRPSLADRRGWATHIGTPKGHNSFYEIHEHATGSLEWFSSLLKASETGLIPREELEDAAKSMTADQMAQEFECSFEAAIMGAIYAKELAAARKDGRIGRVPYDPALPVSTAWDLGVGDSTAIFFIQVLGLEARLVDYYESSGEGLPHYAKVLQDRGYVYGRHIAPHDIAVRELGSGRSRIEVAASLGIKFEIAPNVPLEDGIHAARLWLGRCWIDETRCKAGLESLQHYQWSRNERLGELNSTPVRNFATHGCLTAGSMVSTLDGLRCIEDINAGDVVNTPCGPSTVSAAGFVKLAPKLVSIEIADGRRLTMTPEHKVFTVRGLVAADALRYADILLSEDHPLCLRASSYSKERNIGFRESITAVMRGELSGQAISTGLSGRTLTGLFLRVRTFIIGTAIPSITTWLTLSLSAPRSTCGSTRSTSSLAEYFSPLLPKRLLVQQSGIDHQKGMCGIKRTARIVGWIASSMQRLVSNAAALIQRRTRIVPSGAQQTAAHAPDAMIGRITNRAYALCAGPLFKRTGISPPSLVLKVARIDCSAAPSAVYDLTVDHHHAYYANGVLVSNSDAFRYAALALKDKPQVKPARTHHRENLGGEGWMR